MVRQAHHTRRVLAHPVKHDMPLPFGGGVGEVTPEMGATAFFAGEGSFGYQTRGKDQVSQLVRAPVGRLRQGFLPRREDIGGTNQPFPCAYDAYLIPEELAQRRKAQNGHIGVWFALAQRTTVVRTLLGRSDV